MEHRLVQAASEWPDPNGYVALRLSWKKDLECGRSMTSRVSVWLSVVKSTCTVDTSAIGMARLFDTHLDACRAVAPFDDLSGGPTYAIYPIYGSRHSRFKDRGSAVYARVRVSPIEVSAQAVCTALSPSGSAESLPPELVPMLDLVKSNCTRRAHRQPWCLGDVYTSWYHAQVLFACVSTSPLTFVADDGDMTDGSQAKFMDRIGRLRSDLFEARRSYCARLLDDLTRTGAVLR